ncbi:cache domain-containing protein [Limnobacter sp.]|uniref:cache domain-containing protein n=1 Tax=Limnobacter sp. TaxID=2003368 RepID=UPI0035191AEF
MRKLFCTLAALSIGLSSAAYASPKEETIAFVKQAAAEVKAGKKEQVIQEVNAKNERWYKGELYLIVLDAQGNHLAHPTNQKLLGKSMLDLPDVDGKLFRKERVDIANGKGEGWVDYKYKNPQSGQVEEKSLYVLKAGDVILSAGVYK